MVLAFRISLLKLFKSLQNYWHRVTDITSFGKRLECSLGHTLNFCPNLVQYKKGLLLRCIHHFKSDLINDMDHMRISGTEPSSVILPNKVVSKVKNWCPKSVKTSWSQKGWCNKPTKLEFQSILISFQEYVSKGITHPVFYGDLVYKLRRVKGEVNLISPGSNIVKRLRIIRSTQRSSRGL